MSKVFVFGGTGFVGKNLRKIRPDWVYIGRKDVDLLDSQSVKDYFEGITSNDIVLNLSALVGGIKFNQENQLRMLYENIDMQRNIFENCRAKNVKKIVSALSTCVLPDLVKYSSRTGVIFPMVESDLMAGSPPDSNAGYAYAKRLLEFESRMTNEMGVKSVTFTPTNVFGPYDHFQSERSHFIPSLMEKVASLSPGDKLTLFGTGQELRQNLFAPDLAAMIALVVETYEDYSETIFLSPEQNWSVDSVAKMVLAIAEKDNQIEYPLKHLAGQFRKDVDNSKFKSLYPEFKFTPFEEAVKVTYKWYLDRYRSL